VINKVNTRDKKYKGTSLLKQKAWREEENSLQLSQEERRRIVSKAVHALKTGIRNSRPREKKLKSRNA